MNIPKTKKELKAAETAKKISETKDEPVPVVSDSDRSAIYLHDEGRWISANQTLPLDQEFDDNDFEWIEFTED